jgi:hypothetical protein
MAPAGLHYSIIIDPTELVKQRKSFRVVVISTKDEYEPEFIMPVPPQTGLKGFIVGSWTDTVHELAIQKVSQRLLTPTMNQVIELVRAADAAKQAKNSSTQP